MMPSPLLKLGMDWKVECLVEASLCSDVNARRRDRADDSIAEFEFKFGV